MTKKEEKLKKEINKVIDKMILHCAELKTLEYPALGNYKISKKNLTMAIILTALENTTE